MSKEINYIAVNNNEMRSSDLILRAMKENKIIFIYKNTDKYNINLKHINIYKPGVILKSSGSIKKSKLCFHPISNLNKSAKSSGIWLESQGFNLSKCIIFNTLPLNHISGLMALWRSKVWHSEYINISPNLIKNTKDLIDLSFSIKNVKDKKLITSLVPTQLIRLLKEKNGLNWLKIFDLIWVGGAHLSDELFNNCKKEKINLAPCYGTTETAAMVTSLKPSEFLEGYKNYGNILKDVKIRINNEGTIEVKTERLGYELESRKEMIKFKNQDGWWESGDYGKLIKINELYYLEVLGRKDNAFQSGGETIFPDTIKTRLKEFIFNNKLPIKDLLIQRKEDEIWGNRFDIIINFSNDINQKEIKKMIRLLDKFSKNWPIHERPMSWKIESDKFKLDKMFTNSWKNNF